MWVQYVVILLFGLPCSTGALKGATGASRQEKGVDGQFLAERIAPERNVALSEKEDHAVGQRTDLLKEVAFRSQLGLFDTDVQMNLLRDEEVATEEDEQHRHTAQTARMVVAVIFAALVLVTLKTQLLNPEGKSGAGLKVVTLCVASLYILASLAMNVLNKRAASSFKSTCLLVMIQMLISDVVITAMEWKKMKLGNWIDLGKWLVVPFAFAGMLGTSMYAFKEASLTTILIIRNVLPILTFGVEKAFFNQPEYASPALVFSLIFTLVGSVLYGLRDVSATNLGKILILVNCLFTIIDRLVQAKLLKGTKNFSISIPMCMLLNNTLGIIPIFFLSLITGEFRKWGQTLEDADATTWFLVILSGLCGASLGYVGLRVQQLVSGTSVLVLQNFNKILIIAIGMGVFREKLTPSSLSGCLISLVGCFAYGYLRLPSETKGTSKQDAKCETKTPAMEAASPAKAHEK